MKATSLQQLCGTFRRELRMLLLQIGISRVLVLAAGLVGILITLDWYLHYETLGRAVSLLILLAALGLAVTHEFILSLRRKWSDAEILSYLDAVDPESRDTLVSLHEMVADPGRVGESVTPEGRAILQHAVNELTANVGRIRVGGALERGKARAWRSAAIAVLVLTAAAGVPLREEVSTGLARLLLPFAHIRWSTLTTIEVATPETGWRVPQGEKFIVNLRVTGRLPPELDVVYKSRTTDYWITEHAAVGRDGAAVYAFEEVAEPITFYVKGGDDRTPNYRIDIVERPRIKRIETYYQYPPYAKLPPRKIQSGQIRGLEGTTVRIDFETTLPVKSAAFVLNDQGEEPLKLKTPTSFSKELMLTQDGVYMVKLVDANGFREYQPERYDIQVIPDNPPEVRILHPARDLIATTQAKIKVVLEAKDDFGLTEVRFMYAVGAGESFTTLTDRVTGPIPQEGKESRTEFPWDFSKMDMKKNLDVKYYVFARDCNPSGRGKSESEHHRVNLLPPTQFQQQILYEARRIANEARIAYSSQKKAYYDGLDWVQKSASGAPGDEKWNEVLARQSLAERAAGAVSSWLGVLYGHIEINQMEDAFMKARLDVIRELLGQAQRRVSEVRERLDRTHPMNAAEAAAEKLKATRTAALKASVETQRSAVVILGRILRKMYDWENLQTALVSTKLLGERLTDVHDATRQLAPVTIGKEIEDLPDDLVDKVLTLGKQQRATLETETSLEEELGTIALKADKEGRKTVRQYLMLAFKYVKEKSVNSTLRIIVDRIDNNQLSDAAKDQVAIMQAMKIVEGGLVKAGKDAAEEAIDTAALLKRDADVEAVAMVKKPDAEDSGEAALRGAEFDRKIEELMKETLPTGKDALSQALLAFAEDQDSVRSRTAYLSKILQPEDMPRFRKLKMSLLRYKQAVQAVDAREKVAPLLADSEHKEHLVPMFSSVNTEVTNVLQLIESGNITREVQRLQEDIVESSRDIATFIARQKQIQDILGEHATKGGADEFKRLFVVRGDDLRRIEDLFKDLNLGLTQQAGLSRRSEWLKDLAGQDRKLAGLLEDVSKRLRDRTAVGQKSVAERLDDVRREESAKLSVEVKDKVQDAGVKELPSDDLKRVAEQISRGQIDTAARGKQDEAQLRLREVLGRIRELVDERVAVAENAEAAVASEEAPLVVVEGGPSEDGQEKKVIYTPEEVAKELQPASVKTSIEAADTLPNDLKRMMIREIPSEFPEKYRLLVGAYYKTLIENERRH